MDEVTGNYGITESEIRQRIQWHPVNYGGGESRSSTFKFVNDHRFEFRPQWIFVVIILSAGGLGAAYILRNLYDMMSNGEYDNPGWRFIPGAIGLVIAYFLYKRLGRTAIFDLEQGYYWKGNRKYVNALEKNYEPTDLTLLADIMALQILSEKVETEKDGSRYTFTSYELNLVLHSGERINVVDNGGFYNMKHGAEVISKALNIPLLIQKGLAGYEI